MQISDCPYVAKNCGTYAQCVKCEARKKTVDAIKADMSKYYGILSADCAAVGITGVINSLHTIGFITDVERRELQQNNAGLWYSHK